MIRGFFTLLLFFLFNYNLDAQHSVARQWNEMVLEAIRGDFARPTVHARNLFHTSAAMYDAWAAYDDKADTYFLGKTQHGFTCSYIPIELPSDIEAARAEAISFAVYRIIQHRFSESPGQQEIFERAEELMEDLGFDPRYTSTSYTCGNPAALGNYIAQCIINYGLQDGSNERGEYENLYYQTINPPLIMERQGNPFVTDLNRWQPLTLLEFIDQSGNPIANSTPDFLSPEWGQVLPFSLKEEDLTIYQRDGFDYWVYHDPGPPCYLDTSAVGGLSEEYKWGNALVAIWAGHLDPADDVLWDISPASIGNFQEDFPTTIEGLRDFYTYLEGGDPSPGHTINPRTGEPYPPNIVPRGDYGRVLAEFWADGPDSETPPGHWFTILNYVNDHPDLEKRYRGEGAILDDLEWDVKTYFALGGAMHDVAITAWGIKGWYDYVRPVSAIRGMAELGQSSDPDRLNYHPGGLPLVDGYIELIEEGDSLAGPENEYIGEIKLKAWLGPEAIGDPRTDVAGVGWIKAIEWWPYQRPSFVTPPFAGYVSGHSTYSRAAAELLTEFTGDPFFPGGVGEFYCQKDRFLVFERGPSQDLTLQWATYRDASDQCSLSRIWGGIHPPVDDIPGRLIGIKIGTEVLDFAEQYFSKPVENFTADALKIFPNPTDCTIQIEFNFPGVVDTKVYQSDGRLVLSRALDFSNQRALLNLGEIPTGIYFIAGFDAEGERLFEQKVLRR